jgi:hypothetical protein
MPKSKKKEIRHIIDDAITSALNEMKINPISKKTKKVLSKVSKELSRALKHELKQAKKKKTSTEKRKEKKAKVVTPRKRSNGKS